MKRLLLLTLCAAVLLVCTGCGGTARNDPAPPSSSSAQTVPSREDAPSASAPTVSGQMVQSNLSFAIPFQGFSGLAIEEEYTAELLSTPAEAQAFLKRREVNIAGTFDNAFFESHSIVGLALNTPPVNPYSIAGVRVDGDTLIIGVYETWEEGQTVAALACGFTFLLSLPKKEIQEVKDIRVVINKVTFPPQ